MIGREVAQQSHFRYVAQSTFRDPYATPLGRKSALSGGRCLSELHGRAIQWTGVSDERTRDAAAPAHDRRYGDPQHVDGYTQQAYIRAVKNFSLFFRQSPDKLDFENVRQYRLHLAERGLEATTVNQIMCALRFLYGTTLGKADAAEKIPLARQSDPLPVVLSRQEVARFLKAVSDPKWRTAFITIYAAGLRVSEAASLTVKDIDSARMVIQVRQGKGRKDRYVMLSEQLLAILRDYWKRAWPHSWLFPGQSGRRITTRQLQRVCRAAADIAGLDKTVTVHTLRHSFGTHLLGRASIFV
jgi:integrase/recombinase XerD